MYFLSKVEPLLKMDQAKYILQKYWKHLQEKVSNIGLLIFNLWIPKGYVMSYFGGLRYANASLVCCRQNSAPKSTGFTAKCTLGKFGCAFTHTTSRENPGLRLSSSQSLRNTYCWIFGCLRPLDSCRHW